MKSTDIFWFGQYKGYTLKDVYQGWSEPILEFYKDFITYRLTNAELSWTDGEDKQSRKLVVSDFEFIKEKYVKIHFNITFEINDIGTIKFDNTERLLFSINALVWAGDDYTHRMAFGKANDTILKMNLESKTRYPVFTNSQYIFWCIKEIEEFYINPDELKSLEELELTSFGGINLKHYRKDLFTYTPMIGKPKNEIPEEIKTFNLKKYKNSGKTDSRNKVL